VTNGRWDSRRCGVGQEDWRRLGSVHQKEGDINKENVQLPERDGDGPK
jgi:hypothetical protein